MRSHARLVIGATIGVTVVVIGAVVVHLAHHPRPTARVVTRAAAGGSSLAGRAAPPADDRHDPSAAGARATAITYVATVQTQVIYLGDAGTDRLLRSWMAPGVNPAELASTEARLSAARKALVSDGGQVWWVVAPLAAKVAADDGARATVKVWLVRVIASSGGYVPTSSWSTVSVELVWDPGAGWSVWSVTDTPGPVPQVTTTVGAATSVAFAAALDGFSLMGGLR